MAGIDKTYISTYKEFDEIRNWAKEQKVPYGNKTVLLTDFMFYPDLTEEEWNEDLEYSVKHEMEALGISREESIESYEKALWNTPTFVDVWLIRNCPFDTVQDRLKEQYGGGWSKLAFTDHNYEDEYEQIKAGTSIYDTYQRNGLGKKAKVKIDFFGCHIRDKHLRWWIEVNCSHRAWDGKRIFPEGEDKAYYWYNDELDAWYVDEELMPITSNMAEHKGVLTEKNIVNMVRKWNFPKGTVIAFEGFYCPKGRRKFACEYIAVVS